MAKAGTLTEEGFYRLWFPAERPGDLEQALEAVGAFYRQGRPRQETGPQAYDLLVDAGPIFAAFRRQYGMDLNEAGDMHWWHFLGLLEGLITHSFSQRVSYRVGDLKGLSPEQRAEVLRYRALYRLEGEEEAWRSTSKTSSAWRSGGSEFFRAAHPRPPPNRSPASAGSVWKGRARK